MLQIGFNATTAKLYGADDAAKVAVSTLLSYLVDGYEYTDAFKSRGWDGRSTFFNYTTGTFPRGFVNDVESMLRARGYEVQRVCKPLPDPMGPLNPTVDSFGEDPRYDYQMKTVRALEQTGSMIARIATGGGKSRIALLATARINRPTLFITTRTILMYQMKKAYDKAGFETGILGDGEWEPKFVNVAMVQTLQKRLEVPMPGDNSAAAMRQHRIVRQTLAFLETIEFLIGEEAHESGGNGYYEIAKAMRKAIYRLALTATPFMRDSAEANMRLKATFGPIGIDVTEKLLIERGILARPLFKFSYTACPKGLRKTTPYQRAVELGIVENLERNTDIVREARRAVDYGLSVLILVARKNHGKLLKESLLSMNVRAEYIFGENNNAAREAALDKLRKGEIDVLIGSTILDVGVDAPAVGLVILAGGGKAEVATRQRIGRGMREKKTGPNVCLFIDYHDEHSKHLRGHAMERQAIITQTPGFSENVLANNNDFDYEALGFRRVTNALGS